MKQLLLFIGVLIMSLTASAQCDGTLAIVTLETGSFANEIDFSIANEEGDIVFQLSDFDIDLQSNQIYTATLCVPDGCYAIEMFDSFGDGWNGATLTVSVGNDMFQFELPEGDIDIVNLPINTEDCEVSIGGCTDPSALNYVPWATEDDGSCEYAFTCEGGIPAQLYICTFGSGENVAMEILDSDGNSIFAETDLSNGNILYYDICIDPTECYTVNMWNEAGETGWYGGYFWVNVDGITIAQDQLDDNATEESITFSAGDGCPSEGCTDPEAINYDENADTDNGSCEYCDDNFVEVNLATGIFGSEIMWEILDENGNYVASGNGDYTDGETYTEVACLADGCYSFVMIDNFGDGWNGGVATISLNGEVILEATLDTGDFGVASFSVNSEDCVNDLFGCTDPEANNYNPDATINDGSCEYPVYGCTDPLALNWNPNATEDNGTCIYPVECGEGEIAAQLYVCTFSNGGDVVLEIEDSEGNEVITVEGLSNGQILYFDICIDPTECYTASMSNAGGTTGWSGGYFWINVDGLQIANDSLDDNLNYEEVSFGIDPECGGNEYVFGCTDPAAINFDPFANVDDGSCEYNQPDIFGCTDPEALNYNPLATIDDGSCTYVPDECDANEAIIIVATEIWGNEISWEIVNGEGDVVANGGNYDNNDATTEIACLEDGCYTLNMYDSFGDGWNGGFISILVGDELIALTTLLEGDMESVGFGVNEDCGENPIIEVGCTDPEASNYNPEAILDDGTCEYFFYDGPMYMLTEQETVEPAMFVLTPNPAIENFNLKATALNPEENVQVSIHDMSGRLLYSADFGKDRDQLNEMIQVSDFATGILIVKIVNGEDVQIRQLIKN